MRLVTGPAASLSLILCPQCSTSHRSISDTLLHILFLARISPILDSLFSAAVSPAALQPTTCPDLHGFCHTFPRSGLLCQVSICQSFTPEVCIYRLNVLRLKNSFQLWKKPLLGKNESHAEANSTSLNFPLLPTITMISYYYTLMAKCNKTPLN